MKNKTSILLITILCSICGLFTSCASIINGTRQKVTVTSDPEGATVSNGEISMVTPATFDLKRKRDYIFSISKPGYKTESAKLERVFSGAVAGNIICGGPIGWGVDALTGGQWRLVPENLHVTLRPQEHINIAQNQVQQPPQLPPKKSVQEDPIVVEKEEPVTQ